MPCSTASAPFFACSTHSSVRSRRPFGKLRVTVETLTQETTRSWQNVKEGIDDTSTKLARLSHTGARLSVVATSYRLHQTEAAFLPRKIARRRLDSLHAKNARRLRVIAETHGGAFLKVGQLLSARPDVLPKAFVDELAVLQDAAPRIPFEEIERALEAEIGGPLATWFSSFVEEPIAAASMGQVHRATTRDGIEVAVKILRPGIRKLVEQDLLLLGVFVDALAPMFPPTDHATIVGEIRSSVLRELDLSQEARATIEIGALVGGKDGVVVPKVFEALSTERVLTTEFVRGRKITDVLDELAPRIEAGDARAAERRDSDPRNAARDVRKADLGPRSLPLGPASRKRPRHRSWRDRPFGLRVDAKAAARRAARISRARFRADSRRHGCRGSFARDARLSDAERPSGDAPRVCERARRLVRNSGREARFPTKEELAALARELYAAAASDPVEALPPEFVMLARAIGTLAGLFTHYRPRVDSASRVLPALARGMAS